jgi:hypothetical protein
MASCELNVAGNPNLPFLEEGTCLPISPAGSSLVQLDPLRHELAKFYLTLNRKGVTKGA